MPFTYNFLTFPAFKNDECASVDVVMHTRLRFHVILYHFSITLPEFRVVHQMIRHTKIPEFSCF